MTDVRLIDANALKEWLGCDGDNKYRSMIMHEIADRIDEQPTIDAVPVVRCRECKHWSGRNDKPGEVTAIGYCNHPNHHIMPLMADWFCADGEKMDGGVEP